nr:DNA methyltransferase [Oricola indica]
MGDRAGNCSGEAGGEEVQRCPATDRRFPSQALHDPRAGPGLRTGNFLYVSLELLKKLEGETLEALENIEGDVGLGFQGETVNPSQFFGLEINPRAVAIADLVLWIGFIKWQLKTSGLNAISEPILHAYGTIRHQDAILAYDKKALRRDAQGKPLSRWDGVTRKLHPITGEDIPDPDATVELYDYVNPRIADWPEAEFIVGNPPFIGGKDMRAELGDGYAEACWKARPHMPGGADFVMHFWDEAARRLARKGTAKQPNPLKRFGFITTNSITQTFSRRVIEKYLSAKEPISLVFAVPDHPWMKAADKAAVRIAMTVAEKGEHEGVLAETVREDGLNTDTPRVDLEKRAGKITAKLTVGADLALARPLFANDMISSRGVVLHGAGFLIAQSKAKTLGLGSVLGIEKVIREYRNGRDIAQRPRGVMAIDLFGLESKEVLNQFPAVYQHVLEHVKPERDQNKRPSRRDKWWLYGENIPTMRPVLFSQEKYISTIETSRHRFFLFLKSSILPDNKLVNIGLDDDGIIAVLSSRLHVTWSISKGGWMGVGNDPTYLKTQTFDPFPFPACVTDDSNPALRKRLAELGERLDAFRKERLEKHDFLTMTGIYNVLERVRELEWADAARRMPETVAHDDEDRAGESTPTLHPSPQGGGKTAASPESVETEPRVPPLTASERDIYDAGLIAVLKDIHDEIDRAVFEAYGWSDLGQRLIGRPGATLPSPHKSEDQEAAEEELLSRLVALNLERQAEERRGQVRWLRPDYQIAKLGHKVSKAEEQIEADIAIAAAAAEKPKWPSQPFDQIRIVKDVLAKAAAPASPAEVAATFDGRNTPKRKGRVDEVLKLLAETGGARTGELDGETRYFVAR